jgi:hypothetical protein
MNSCLKPNFKCFLKAVYYLIFMAFIVVAVLMSCKIFLIIHEETSLSTLFSVCTSRQNLPLFFTALFGLVSLYVAGRQLSKQSDVACINSLIDLRRQLTTGNNRRVHFLLSQEEDQEMLAGGKIVESGEAADAKGAKLKKLGLKAAKNVPMIDAYNYLGTLELGVDMVKNHLVDAKTFKNHIGYRIDNIFDGKSEVHKNIREHIKTYKQYYPNLLWIRRKMSGMCCEDE